MAYLHIQKSPSPNFFKIPNLRMTEQTFIVTKLFETSSMLGLWKWHVIVTTFEHPCTFCLNLSRIPHLLHYELVLYGATLLNAIAFLFYCTPTCALPPVFACMEFGTS